MRCPRCGGFTQYFKSFWLSCRDCGWKEVNDMTEKEFNKTCRQILNHLDQMKKERCEKKTRCPGCNSEDLLDLWLSSDREPNLQCRECGHYFISVRNR